jgi:hypothetical protein
MTFPKLCRCRGNYPDSYRCVLKIVTWRGKASLSKLCTNKPSHMSCSSIMIAGYGHDSKATMWRHASQANSPWMINTSIGRRADNSMFRNAWAQIGDLCKPATSLLALCKWHCFDTTKSSNSAFMRYQLCSTPCLAIRVIIKAEPRLLRADLFSDYFLRMLNLKQIIYAHIPGGTLKNFRKPGIAFPKDNLMSISWRVCRPWLSTCQPN